jgi:hypothetical protein
MGKKSKSGSGINIPDHISENSETNFWIKILKFLDADPDPTIVLTPGPGSGMEIFGTGINIPGSTTLLATLFFVTVNPDNNVCGGRVSETS